MWIIIKIWFDIEQVQSEIVEQYLLWYILIFSYPVVDELQVKLEEKITKLEAENQEINHEILNIRHLYSEMKNENVSLKLLLDRANESVLHAQNEMEQYKARAQRILQEKENLLSFKQEEGFTDLNQKITALSNFIEDLKFVFDWFT